LFSLASATHLWILDKRSFGQAARERLLPIDQLPDSSFPDDRVSGPDPLLLKKKAEIFQSGVRSPQGQRKVQGPEDLSVGLSIWK